jgi:hypothetical protein
MRKTLPLLVLVLSSTVLMAQTRTRTTLDIYVVDVEGGNAVLFISPSGESVLIDTGNGAPGAVRDAERIVAAVHDAGLNQIDHLIITHYHADHIGGLSELAARVPIKHFIDHGQNIQPGPAIDPIVRPYEELWAKAKHTVVKAGDRIPVAGLDWLVVTSAGKVLKTPLPGAGKPNPYCSRFSPPPRRDSALVDDQSVGSFITFGKFRAAHLADPTQEKQFELMCPNNPLGTADFLITARHGVDNAEIFVHALRPRAVVMNNGPRKGGGPQAMKVLFSSPGLEDVWQLHFSQLGGQEYTVPGMFIANAQDEPLTAMPVAPIPDPRDTPQIQAPPAPQHNGTAYYIKVSAKQDGTFTITNMRNGFNKTYATSGALLGSN